MTPRPRVFQAFSPPDTSASRFNSSYRGVASLASLTLNRLRRVALLCVVIPSASPTFRQLS
ncbi:hypothetical protein FOXYSP1_08057 [Fusarium oxysporum f. sp. phaseoli]